MKAAVWATAAALTAAGCAVGPDFHAPPAPGVDRYLRDGNPEQTTSADGVAQRFIAATVPADWWRAFGSPALDKAMETAVASNPTLEQAHANLRAAQDLLRAGAGVFYPQVAGSADVSRQAAVPAKLGQTGASSLFTLWTLGASVSYAVDVFGGNRRAVEALAAQTEGQRYAVAAAYLSLTGNLVNAVIARAAYGAQIDTTRSLITVVREQVEIAHAQVEAGVMAHASELSLAAQLASLEASLPPLEQKRDQAAHLEAVLTGRFPSEADAADVALSGLQLPVDLPTLVPSELVRQRPDVLAAQARLHQASAEVGVATAAMLPALTLSADYARMSARSADLFGAQAGAWSLGANLVAPLFEGGTLYFRRAASKQALQAADANYRQVVLASFEQVADVLRALAHDAAQLDAQLRAQSAASAAVEEINADYRAGVASYLQVLSADLQYQQAVLGTLQVRAQRLQDTVALFLALGGGWRGASLEAPVAAHAP
ncbi:efflux transporter outer membrane subunit [Ralstonia soli]|uniref:Efflux transporter outer membrane subunit n=1 Tax=Ralstonia soli TaxID=2953896 RepID=A0ABT1AKD0_9RALS|nr:efflux transporter outer membrane subunit [Ralstonia soli]MCO5398878.1 efflux transporter outer membrane subunit [Ralstonia soli]